MGEHFSEATRWLQGDQEDGAMNYYGFAHPVREWLAELDIAYQPARLDTRELSAWLDGARGRIPYENQLAQLNLLDSHDTWRFLTLVGGSVEKMTLAVALLFGYPGAPCIYYGDEIGLEGGRDPDCRRCFDWERGRWNHSLFEHYRAMIALRKARGELRHGAYQALVADGDVFAFGRFTDAAASVFMVHRGRAPVVVRVPVWQLPIAARWRTLDGEPVAGDAGHVDVTVAPRTSLVLLGDAC
jgi:alpha-glucosidase